MNIWALPPLISAIISVFILLYIFNLGLITKFNKIFFFIVIIAFIWSFSEFNYRVTNDEKIAFVWTNIAKVWIFILPLTCDLIFTFVDKKIKNKIIFYIIIYGITISFYIIDILNLAMSNLVKNYWGYSYIKPGNIYFFLLYLIGTTGMAFFNGGLSLYYAIRKKELKNLFFLLAIFIPLLSGVLTEVVLPFILNIEIPELTTASFTITFFIIIFLIQKYNLFVPDLKKSIDTILLTMSDALFILDKDFKIKIVNKSVERLLNYEENRLIDKSILLYISEKFLTRFIRMLKFAMSNDYIIKDEESIFLTKENKEIPVSFSCSLIKDNNSKTIIGLLLIVRDITTRKNLEEMLEISNESFINIIEKNIEGIIILDKNLSINYINPVGKKFLNIEEKNSILKFPYNLDKYSIQEIEITISENEKGIGELITIPTKWKKEDAFLVIIRDITTRKAMEHKLISSLKEKEYLLSETHHRIKNNLQIVMSLLKLPLRLNDDPVIKNILIDSQSRIKTMALIHEMLYNKTNFFEIDFKEYVNELIKFLLTLFQNQSDIKVNLIIDNVIFDSDTSISCGLIITELFTNSIKYAFNNQNEKIVTIILTKNDNHIDLIYKDNGKGILENINLENIKTTGLYLIKLLTLERLKGRISINAKNGFECNISFDLKEEYL